MATEDHPAGLHVCLLVSLLVRVWNHASGESGACDICSMTNNTTGHMRSEVGWQTHTVAPDWGDRRRPFG